jgi:hypothetical protein
MYLFHACVESDCPRNLYSGIATLDSRGMATVKLPRWFEALNTDVCYQLTCVGAFAPVYVVSPIKRNQFKIAGGKKGLSVSWQVSGTRQDAIVKANPLKVEQRKPRALPKKSSRQAAKRRLPSLAAVTLPPSPTEPKIRRPKLKRASKSIELLIPARNNSRGEPPK